MSEKITKFVDIAFLHKKEVCVLNMKSLLTIILVAAFICANAQQEPDRLIRLGVEAMNEKDHEKSLELLTEAKTLAEENKWYEQLFLAINNIGANYYSMLDYGEALDNYLEAYTIAIKELDEDHEMIVLNNIAILYSREKQFDKAEEYFKKAYLIAKRRNEKIKTGMYAVNLGIVANERKEPHLAKKYLEEAMTLLQERPDILIQANIALAQNHYLLKDYKSAKTLALSLLQQLPEEGLADQQVALLLVLSETSFAENDPNAAINYAKRALAKSTSLDSKINIYERLSVLYAETGQYTTAIEAKDTVIQAREELNQIKNGRLFETNRVKFEIQNYQKKLQDNQQKLASERKRFYAILAMALLVIVLITWALRNSYIKNKQRKIIHKRSEEIMTLELEKEKSDNLLLEKQLKEKETLALLEQEKLKNEIEVKNRKLAAKALHLSNRNELIESIVESLSRQPEISKDRNLKQHIQQLKNHLKNDAEWESFLTHFEEVNHGFLSALKERHPALTSNDIRFLSYVYMNLSIKEISLLLNITPEASRKRKERISKKMELTEKDDLYSYISTL